jgi:adrenodoxin-NADP+ reductase
MRHPPQNCQHKFDELASDPRFKFYGNVYIGSPPDNDIWHSYSYPHALHIPISSLFPYYNNILLTYGASTSNPLPTTKGSSYSPQPAGNVLPALAFVSWYNGHPAYADLRPKFENVTDATIIGHGNVAIDCARILLKSPEALAGTDIPESVLEVLRSNRVRHVQAVGRRGPAQVAFTTKEFREMLNLDGVEYAGIDKALMDDAKSMVEKQGDRARKRLLGLMDKGVDRNKISPSNKVFELGFLKSPMAFLPDSSTGDVNRIRWSINSLLAPPAPPPSPAPSPPTTPAVSSNTNLSAAVVARPTGEEIETLSGLVIESVGYRSENIARNDGWSLPFDQRRGRVVNDGGRVVDESGVMVRLSPSKL